MAEEETKDDPKEEVEGTPLINDDDQAKFEENANFKIPSTRAELEAQEDEKKDEATEDDKPDEDKVVDEPDEDEEPGVTAVDPGQFEPGDYAFEVTVYDEEGKSGRTRKITSIEQWDELLDSDPNLGTGTAMARALRLANKMETGIDRDKASWEAKKATYDQEIARLEAQTKATETMAAEMDYLVERGDLPKIASQYKNADWSDPDVAKQPGVKEQLALLDYMRTENNRRAKRNLTPMRSVLEAFNAFTIDENKKTAIDAKAKADKARKTAGAKVAGASPNPTRTAPPGISVGRGGSLEDLSRLLS